GAGRFRHVRQRDVRDQPALGAARAARSLPAAAGAPARRGRGRRLRPGAPHRMSADRLEALRMALRGFAAEREWEPFHTPKNLAMALAGEAGEVIEHFQWLTAEQSAALDPARREEVALELA